MRRYNFIRPLFIIIVALLVKNIATNVSILIGATKETASSIGFIAMIIAAFIIFNRFNKNKPNR